MQNLDTHKIIESFIARGIPKEQAEIFVEAGIIIANAQFDNLEKDYSNLVTKNDLKISFMEFKEELMKELDLKFATKDDLKLAVTQLENSIEKMNNKLLMWIISFFGTTFLSTMALIITILFNKG